MREVIATPGGVSTARAAAGASDEESLDRAFDESNAFV
jgi:hypothetical protein